MTETLNERPRLGEISESGEEYTPLSGLAVIGLLFGLFSPLAFVGPALYIIAVGGIVLCVAALIRIGTDSPVVAGRKLALVGLVLSTSCISVAPSYYLVSRHLIRNEARQFALAWFGFLAANEPFKAHQLSKSPQYRLALDDQLSNAYAEDVQLTEDFAAFTENVGVQMLLNAGNGAQIRFHETQAHGREYGGERVDLLYCISFVKGGRKLTRFVGLTMRRVDDVDDGRASWYVSDYDEQPEPT